jgi:hypothetical protein
MLMMMSFVLDLHDDDDDVLCTRPTRLYGFVSTDRE